MPFNCFSITFIALKAKNWVAECTFSRLFLSSLDKNNQESSSTVNYEISQGLYYTAFYGSNLRLKQLSGVPLQCRLLASPTKIRLGWKGLPRSNTLAYYENPLITTVKSFIVQAPECWAVHYKDQIPNGDISQNSLVLVQHHQYQVLPWVTSVCATRKI